MRETSSMRRTPILVVLLFAAAVPCLAAEYESEQGFFRVVEGEATLVRVEDGEPEQAQVNSPVLPGDRVWLSGDARVEVILPDAHRVRLGDGADLELVALARSLDQESEATVLELHAGALAIDVPE